MTQVFGNDAATVDAIDTEFLIKDDIDPTKILKLQVSGLTTGTTRTLTVPNADGTIALTGGLGIVSIDGVANAGGDVDLVAGSTKVSITPNDALNNITLDVVEANLTLSNIGGAVTDAQVPNTITLDNLTQITTKSHTVLSDIGTNTHPQIDTHIANVANPHVVTATQVGAITSVDGVSNAGGNVDLIAGSTKLSITPDDALNTVTFDINEANLSLSNIGGAVTDAQVPNTITLDNLTQVTTRSHTALSDIGTNTHPQIDTHIAGAISGSGTANKVPKFTAIRTVADSQITDIGTNVGIGVASPTAKLYVQQAAEITTPVGRFEAAVASYTGTTLLIDNTLADSSTYNLFAARTDSDADAGGPFTKFLVRGDGNVGIGTVTPTSKLHVVGLPIHANNAAAITGGLTAGAFYRNGADPDLVCVVH